MSRAVARAGSWRGGLLTLLGSAAIALVLCFRAASCLEGNLPERAAHGPTPGLWGHRGLPGPGAPPNSPDAVLRAAEAGLGGVEIDVRWTGAALVAAHGAVEEHPTPAPGEAPPPLAAVLAAGPGLSFWLDFKGLDDRVAREAAAELGRILGEAGAVDRTWVEGKRLGALLTLRTRVPGLRIALRATAADRARPFPPYLLLLWRLGRHPIDAVSWHADDITIPVARRLEPVTLLAYGAEDAAAARRLLGMGVEVVLVDALPPDARQWGLRPGGW